MGHIHTYTHIYMSASLRHNMIEWSKKKIQLFQIFCEFVCRWLSSSVDVFTCSPAIFWWPKNPYGRARNYSFVCPSPHDHIVRSHSVLAIYFFFIMMIDRSIKSSEVLLFAHHHSIISKPYAHKHTCAFSFFLFHVCCIVVYHWAQSNGFTVQFSREKNKFCEIQTAKLIYISIDRPGDHLRSTDQIRFQFSFGSRHFWNGDFILIIRTPKNESKELCAILCQKRCSLNCDVIRKEKHIKQVKIIVIFFHPPKIWSEKSGTEREKSMFHKRRIIHIQF